MKVGTLLEELSKFDKLKKYESVFIDEGQDLMNYQVLQDIDNILEEGLNVQVVMFPDGEDPDSYAINHTDEELAEMIEKRKQDFITFKASVLMSGMNNDPIKKSKLIRIDDN